MYTASFNQVPSGGSFNAAGGSSSTEHTQSASFKLLQKALDSGDVADQGTTETSNGQEQQQQQQQQITAPMAAAPPPAAAVPKGMSVFARRHIRTGACLR